MEPRQKHFLDHLVNERLLELQLVGVNGGGRDEIEAESVGTVTRHDLHGV
jgi:hypothetical protein